MFSIFSKERNSSIEILKIIAIVLIITNHAIQTLGANGNLYVPFEGYGIDLNGVTTNIQFLIISMMRYSGIIGNTVFFVCSAWFLLDNATVSKKKILLLLADMWFISFIILVIVLIHRKGNLDESLIVKSLFPFIFGNYWYVNCYIIFYAIHPILNKIIMCFDQKTMFRVTFSLASLYLFISFFTRLTVYLFGAGTTFFGSNLIVWVVIYLIVGYLKLYAPNFTHNKKRNIQLVMFGFIGNFGLVLLTNYIGMKFEVFSNALLIWNESYNPFVIAFVIGLFNLVNDNRFVNKPINYISKQSFFIYIIHENVLLGMLYRPAMWFYVYSKYGYSLILYWLLLIVLIIFFFSLFASIFYYETIHYIVSHLCEKIYSTIVLLWNEFEMKMINSIK